MSQGKTVVVLGGSLGGMSVTHRLLKYTRRHEKDLKVILVTKNSHFYWNLASVRAVLPGAVRDEELLQPIEPGLAQYPSDSYEFVLGAATALDPAAKTVQVATETDKRTISYDYLVLATGANSVDPEMPWKASGTYEELLESLHDTLVGGDSTAGAVEKELLHLGVTVRKGVKATDISKTEYGKTRLVLSDGETLITDLYLPTTGQKPNTDYLPAEFLTSRRYVNVDDFLQVRGTKDIWAVGDIVSKPRAGFLITESQAAGVVTNIEHILQGKDQVVPKGPLVDAFLFAMGRSRGCGRVGPICAPSLFVWFIKGRTLGMQRTKKYADGSFW
ncbi:Oxidoreductase ptaL [Cladobotryum mycophilum]|uniref:Oxidoreductase ptaL n=1 Tax=Cladobotryum mycophilum TaxID=491253 RepID=A0ABR0T3H9_9HYPO